MASVPLIANSLLLLKLPWQLEYLIQFYLLQLEYLDFSLVSMLFKTTEKTQILSNVRDDRPATESTVRPL